MTAEALGPHVNSSTAPPLLRRALLGPNSPVDCDHPQYAVWKEDFLSVSRMVRLCLTAGKVEHFHTAVASVRAMPGAYLRVVVVNHTDIGWWRRRRCGLR